MKFWYRCVPSIVKTLQITTNAGSQHFPRLHHEPKSCPPPACHTVRVNGSPLTDQGKCCKAPQLILLVPHLGLNKKFRTGGEPNYSTVAKEICTMYVTTSLHARSSLQFWERILLKFIRLLAASPLSQQSYWTFTATFYSVKIWLSLGRY